MAFWYYLRYIGPTEFRAPSDPDKLAKWLPVDLYIGAEHAVFALALRPFLA